MENKENNTITVKLKDLLCEALYMEYYNMEGCDNVAKKINDSDILNNSVDNDTCVWVRYRMRKGVISPTAVLKKYLFGNKEAYDDIISKIKEEKLNGKE